MEHQYIIEVSLFFDMIPQHHDVIVSSWQGFYSCHGRNQAPELFLL